MTIDFDAFCQELTTDNALSVHPAEIHGLGCGILVAGFRPDPENLFAQIDAYTDGTCSASLAIIDIFNDCLQLLEEDSFEFQLCLPDDDVYELSERAECLSAWCAGFLHGFAAVQNPLSSEAQELLRDITEISRLDTTALSSEEEDENERYYAELTEFVRMAVISLFMDNSLNKTAKSGESKDVRH